MNFYPCAFSTSSSDSDFELFANGIVSTKSSDQQYHAILQITGFRPSFFIALPPEWFVPSRGGNIDILRMKADRLMRFINNKKSDMIEEMAIVIRHEFMHFTNMEKFPFLEIKTNSMQNFYKLRNYFGRTMTIRDIEMVDYKFKLYESDIDPILKLVHKQSLPTSGWWAIDSEIETDSDGLCPIIRVSYQSLQKSTLDIAPKLRIATFDIECYSDDGSFPTSGNIGHPIIMIGITIREYQSKETQKWIGVIAPTESEVPCNPIEAATVVNYKSEKELILGFAKALIENHVNILTGYNIFGFDMRYIYERSALLDIEEDLMDALTYMEDYPGQYEVKELVSSGLGDNLLHLLKPNGIVIFDLMKTVQAGIEKLSSYKLDDVAEHYLGQNKHDISPKEIFQYFTEGTEKRTIIAEYCIQDCVLVSDLVDKLCVATNHMGMANVCYVPLQYIFLRGQGIKIYSLVAKFCQDNNFVIPSRNRNEEIEPEEKYQGAFVLNMTPGFYTEPIFVLDFNALYPSSQIAANLSHDTLVTDPKYDNLPNVEYKDVSYIEGGRTITCRWARRLVLDEHGNRVQEKGILPKLLSRLLDERKAVRAKMKFEKDEFQKSVLNGLQNALKVTCNSVYGQTGAFTSNVYLRELAASTTALGRAHLTFSRDYIVEKYGYECIYGDSVASYTPVLVKHKNVIKICEIKDLHKLCHRVWLQMKDNVHECDVHANAEEHECDRDVRTNTTPNAKANAKEFCNLDDVMTWTDSGWTKVERVIRHKLAPTKKMMRVITPRGMVDVTDDHSLIRSNGEEISPKDLVIGDSLLHARLPLSRYVEDVCLDPENLGKLYERLGDTIETFPEYLLNSSIDCRTSFLQGLFHKSTTLYSTNQLYLANVYYLIQSVGAYASLDENCLMLVDEMNDHDTIFHLTEIDVVDRYVYDLTTSNHHFQAGVGEMIVHNTDSVFIKPTISLEGKSRKEIITEVIKIGKIVSDDVTSVIGKKEHPVLKLAYEKVFYQFGMLSRKRYIGVKYMEEGDEGELTTTGDAMKRRDSAPIVKKIYGGMLEAMFRQDDKPIERNEILMTMREQIIRLLNGDFPIEDFFISVTLKSKYKNPQSIPHKVLADRIAERDPGNAVQTNDRMRYLFIECLDKMKTTPGENIETLDYIRENNLQLDYLHYLEHQVLNPIKPLLTMLGTSEDMIDDLIQEAKKRRVDKKKRCIHGGRGYRFVDEMLW